MEEHTPGIVPLYKAVTNVGVIYNPIDIFPPCWELFLKQNTTLKGSYVAFAACISITSAGM